MTLRQTIADGPASIGERMRARRWDVLLSTFPQLAEYDVLDLGGTAGSWLRKDVRPRSLTLLNLEATELTVDAAGAALPEWITIRTGDACAPPPDIAERRFDLIFSNSLIEHVGGPAKRQAMADFVRLATKVLDPDSLSIFSDRAPLDFSTLSVSSTRSQGARVADLASDAHALGLVELSRWNRSWGGAAQHHRT